MTIIYAIRNRDDGRHYIGKTGRDLRRRWAEHLSKAIKGTKMYIDRAIAKHGAECFHLYILATVDKSLANETERLFIALFESNKEKYGYNLTDGGDGQSGFVGYFKNKKFSPEHRAKIAKAKTGQAVSAEARQKISAANKGRQYSLATRQIWSAQRTGRVHSEETKRKMAESRKQWWRRRLIEDWVVN